jgi:hypothetical protein
MTTTKEISPILITLCNELSQNITHAKALEIEQWMKNAITNRKVNPNPFLMRYKSNMIDTYDLLFEVLCFTQFDKLFINPDRWTGYEQLSAVTDKFMIDIIPYITVNGTSGVINKFIKIGDTNTERLSTYIAILNKRFDTYTNMIRRDQRNIRKANGLQKKTPNEIATEKEQNELRAKRKVKLLLKASKYTATKQTPLVAGKNMH